MKKNKSGFTLVELLAVIVVLGIIMAVAGTAALKIKKNANKEEAKKLERTIEELGASIYTFEKAAGGESQFNSKFSNGQPFKINVKTLADAGYLKNVVREGSSAWLKSPSGGEPCTAYLLVDPTLSLGGKMFESYIFCGGLYETKSVSYSDYPVIVNSLTQNISN